MSFWIDQKGAVYDDHEGEALSLPGWSDGLTRLDDAAASKFADEMHTRAKYAQMRAERETRLAAALSLLDRHRNQKDFGIATTLTDTEAGEWAAYAQALRDIPQGTADPSSPVWPDMPSS